MSENPDHGFPDLATRGRFGGLLSLNPSFRTPLAIDSLAVGRSFLPTGEGAEAMVGVIRGANYIIEIERGEWRWGCREGVRREPTGSSGRARHIKQSAGSSVIHIPLGYPRPRPPA